MRAATANRVRRVVHPVDARLHIAFEPLPDTDEILDVAHIPTALVHGPANGV